MLARNGRAAKDFDEFVGLCSLDYPNSSRPIGDI